MASSVPGSVSIMTFLEVEGDGAAALEGRPDLSASGLDASVGIAEPRDRASRTDRTKRWAAGVPEPEGLSEFGRSERG